MNQIVFCSDLAHCGCLNAISSKRYPFVGDTYLLLEANPLHREEVHPGQKIKVSKC